MSTIRKPEERQKIIDRVEKLSRPQLEAEYVAMCLNLTWVQERCTEQVETMRHMSKERASLIRSLQDLSNHCKIF